MAVLVLARQPYWILAMLCLLNCGSNIWSTMHGLPGERASACIHWRSSPLTCARKPLPALRCFARVVCGFRTATLNERRQGQPLATTATHDALLRCLLVDGGIRSTVFADMCEFSSCPNLLSRPYWLFSRGLGPTPHIAMAADDRMPCGVRFRQRTPYRTGLHTFATAEHHHFFRWALPALEGCHNLHANSLPGACALIQV